MPEFWALAAIAAKCALYIGVLGAAGTVLAALIFGFEAYKRTAALFGALALVASLVVFSLRGAGLTGDASGMTDPQMLGLLWGTPVGSALTYRIGGVAILLGGLAFGRAGLCVAGLGGALAVWSFDHVGHVPDRDIWQMDVALCVHLLAVSVWIGILIPLRGLARSPHSLSQATALAEKFGRFALIAVPVLIVMGLFLVYQLVGTWAALFGTGYGQAMLIKVSLVALLLGLAAANKLRFVPQMRRGDVIAAQHLARSITLEWVVVALILTTTAVLTSILSLPSLE